MSADVPYLLQALRSSPYPALRPPDRRFPAYRLYEAFALQHTVQTLARRFHGQAWQPHFPPQANVFLKEPYFRLPLPPGFGELIWQPVYPNLDGFPIQSLTHIMRPDIVVEGSRQGSGRMLILDAKYRFSPKAAIEILDSLHAYRDGLVDPDGREVVPFAVALTAAAARRASRDYYTRRLFRRSGLGLILLEPQPPLAPAADLLSLEEVLDAYWSA